MLQNSPNISCLILQLPTSRWLPDVCRDPLRCWCTRRKNRSHAGAKNRESFRLVDRGLHETGFNNNDGSRSLYQKTMKFVVSGSLHAICWKHRFSVGEFGSGVEEKCIINAFRWRFRNWTALINRLIPAGGLDDAPLPCYVNINSLGFFPGLKKKGQFTKKTMRYFCVCWMLI